MPLRFVRKVLGILRGGSTPFEIGLAVTLGILLGMIPGFSLLTLLLIVAALLLNIPVRIFILALIVGKLLSVPLAPLTYGVGALLLSIGPVESLARLLVNAPVTAWMDFDRYCTLGGIPAGLLIGVGASIFLTSLVKSFRKKMAEVESRSEKFAAVQKNIFFRFFAWLVFGGRTKGRSYAEILAMKTRIFRKSGLIVSAVVVVLVFAFVFIFAGSLARSGLVSAMEAVNGATVDVDSVDLNIFGGNCTVKGIQVCDYDHLDKNLVSVGEIRFALGMTDILSKRFVIDEVAVIDAATDTLRKEAGRRFIKEKPLPEEKPPAGTKNIWDYFEDAKIWKERIERLYRIYERLKPKEQPGPTDEEKERIGLKDLRASYLVDKSPAVLVRKITIGGLTISLGGTAAKYDIDVTNLSTDARLAGADPAAAFRSADKAIFGDFTFSAINPSNPNIINLIATNVSLADIQKILSSKNAVRFKPDKSGKWGSADLSIKGGKFSPGSVDIPLDVSLKNSKAGGGEQGVLGHDPKESKDILDVLGDLNVTLIIEGKPYAPYLKFDERALAKSFGDIVEKKLRGIFHIPGG